MIANTFIWCLIIMLAILFLASVLQLGDHFLLHLIDIGLLLFQPLACCLNVFLQKEELLKIEIAILGLSFKVFLLFRGAFSPSFNFACHFLLSLLLLGVIISIFGTISLLLEHLVDHILDITWRRVIFNLSPLLHDCVFEFDSQLVFAQGFLVQLI